MVKMKENYLSHSKKETTTRQLSLKNSEKCLKECNN